MKQPKNHGNINKYEMMRFLTLHIFLIVTNDSFAQENSNAKPPNIVLILVDDSGLMDFGSFGGEAQTRILTALQKVD